MTWSRLVFLGTGSSSGVPSLNCVVNPEGKCQVCSEALANPESSKNFRGNVSMLIQYDFASAEGRKNVMIDCGKTFRQSVQRFFRKFDVSSIDAVLVTHEHADAVLGLDDIRDLQKYVYYWDPVAQAQVHRVTDRIELHCSGFSLERLRLLYPYMLPSASPAPPASGQPLRYVGQLDPRVFSDERVNPDEEVPPFTAAGRLRVQPIRVLHGGDYVCYGFLFGPAEKAFVYLSDISAMTAEAERVLQDVQIHVLVLDSLFIERTHGTHYSLPQSLEFVRKYRPTMTRLVGMTHEWDYNTMNKDIKERMAKEGLDVEMAYDGLSLELDL